MDEITYAARLRELADAVAAAFRSSGVYRIDARAYEDSTGSPSVRFTVWLHDKPGDATYSWDELSVVEHALGAKLRSVDPESTPYTDYVLESEAAERAAMVG